MPDPDFSNSEMLIANARGMLDGLRSGKFAGGEVDAENNIKILLGKAGVDEAALDREGQKSAEEMAAVIIEALNESLFHYAGNILDDLHKGTFDEFDGLAEALIGDFLETKASKIMKLESGPARVEALESALHRLRLADKYNIGSQPGREVD